MRIYRWASLILLLMLAACNQDAPDGATTQTFRESVNNAETASITLEIDVARTEVTPLSDFEDLFVAQTTYFGTMEFTVTGEADRVITLRNTQTRSSIRDGEDLLWQVALNQEIPTALTINGGVADTLLELQTIQLTALNVSGGVGDIQIFLPEGAYTAEINGDVGEITITLPAAGAVRVEATSGIGELDVAERLERASSSDSLLGASGIWQTPGYEDAAAQIDLRVTAGTGDVTIR